MKSATAALRRFRQKSDRVFAFAHSPIKIGGFAEHAVIGWIFSDQLRDHRRRAVFPTCSRGAFSQLQLIRDGEAIVSCRYNKAAECRLLARRVLVIPELVSGAVEELLR